MVEPHVAHAAPAARYASYDREIVTWMDLFLTSEGLRRCTLYVFIAYVSFRLFVPLFDERKIERDRMWRSHATRGPAMAPRLDDVPDEPRPRWPW